MRRTWIYQRKGWPKFTWDDSALLAPLAEVSNRQGRLIAKIEGLGAELSTEASLGSLTEDVIKSSAIEGERLDREEVRSSLAKRLRLKLAEYKKASRNVEGFVDVVFDATSAYEKSLTKKRLLSWHKALFPTGQSGLSKITVGAWRKASSGEMQVVSGAMGAEKVHFVAPPASELNQEMKAFLSWFESESDLNPILKAAVAHFWFVTIHPFEDGNGRLARVISDMALARADKSAKRYYSMSNQIALKRKEYYEKLEMQQRADLDITSWMLWFLEALKEAITSSGDLLNKVFLKGRVLKYLADKSLNKRQLKVINLMLGEFKGQLNSSKYAKLTKCSTDTALRDINGLLALGVLKQNEGGGRSTSYRLSKNPPEK